MSARKAGSTGAGSLHHNHHHHLTVEARQTRLTLSPDAVVIAKNGIEFRSSTPFPEWNEMTLTLSSPHGERVHCNGVVISCTGNKHAGYHVSMVFTGVSKQGQARLSSLAHSQVF